MTNPENKILALPLTGKAFAPFGDVIEKGAGQSFAINNGQCIRHHGLSRVSVGGEDAHVLINIFSGQPYTLPHQLTMVERHPLGSQAFFPTGPHPYLVIVCEDDADMPVQPTVFLARHDQGINLSPNVWHGVLTPLYEPSDFLVVDRGGEGENLQEHHFDAAYSVEVPEDLLENSATG